MAKSKSLGYQIHSALAEINLQDKEKRTDIFNKENNTNYKSVGKREFKKNGTSINYIFSKRSAENIAEKHVIQRHLSHSSERQDLKKIYLYS